MLDEGKLLMEEAVDNFKQKLSTLRTGRANTSLVHGVTVDYYGVPTPLEQMAQISVTEGTQIVIKPFDPSVLKEVEKELNDSHLNLPIQNDGENIRINVPALSHESRQEEAKKIGAFSEEAKVQIRNVRRDLNDDIKSTEALPEDQEKRELDNVQKLTDEYIAKIDQIGDEKTEEIMNV